MSLIPQKERKRVFANAAFTLVAQELQKNPGDEDEAVENVIEKYAPVNDGIGASERGLPHTKATLKRLVLDKCKKRLHIPLNTFTLHGLDAVAVQYRMTLMADLAKFKAHRERFGAPRGAVQVIDIDENVITSEVAGNPINDANAVKSSPTGSPEPISNDRSKIEDSPTKDPVNAVFPSQSLGDIASGLPFEKCIMLSNGEASSTIRNIYHQLRSDVSNWCLEMDGRNRTTANGARNNPKPLPALEALYQKVFGAAWKDKFIHIAAEVNDYIVLEALVSAAVFTHAFRTDMDKSRVALQIIQTHDWSLFADNLSRHMPKHLLDYFLQAATFQKLERLDSTYFAQEALRGSATVCTALRSHVEYFDLPKTADSGHFPTLDRFVPKLLLEAIKLRARLALATRKFVLFWRPTNPPADFLFTRFPGLKVVGEQGQTEVILEPEFTRRLYSE